MWNPKQKDQCPFCLHYIHPDIILKGGDIYVKWAKEPINEGHSLIVPFSHRKDWFDCTYSEKIKIVKMIDLVKGYLSQKYKPDGFTISMDIGEAAGQTVSHCYVNIIPRYKK